jgi:hypothetical protein
MAGAPADQGGKGVGGYIVFDDIMISYLDFEGAAGYTFEVADNDTIHVTEILEFTEGGAPVLGETAPFTRVAGSSVNRENKPFVLTHPYLGPWQFEADMDGYHVYVEYRMNSDGTYEVMQNIGGEIYSYMANYFVFDHILVVYVEGEGFSEAVITDVDDYSITVSDGEETGYLTRIALP